MSSTLESVQVCVRIIVLEDKWKYAVLYKITDRVTNLQLQSQKFSNWNVNLDKE